MAAANTATRSTWNTIVVVGAGIGGLTAALALAGAGYRVVIVERNVDLSEAGAGIQISPNAGRVLVALGLDAAIAARAIEPASIDVRSGATGDLITALPASAFARRYGLAYRVIHRADLQAVLVAAVRAHPAIAIETGATVSQTLKQDNGLLVRITSPVTTDVVPAVAVIAADGVWSSFREKIPGGATPALTGRTAWRAVIPADSAAHLAALDRVGLWLGPDAHLVHYPIARGAALNVVAIVREDWDKRGWSAPGDKAEIARRFRDWSTAARKIIAAPLVWHKYAIATVDPRKAWTDGRLALLGDAAHAMQPYLAQGAAMAIEDAAVLAAHLRGASDIPAALRAYETTRKARVAKVAAAAVAIAGQYHATGFMALARDTALRFAGPRLILNRNDWIYRWTADDRPGP